MDNLGNPLSKPVLSRNPAVDSRVIQGTLHLLACVKYPVP